MARALRWEGAMVRLLAALALVLGACTGSVPAPGIDVDAGPGAEPGDEDDAEAEDLPRDATVHVDLDDIGSTIAPDVIGFSLEYPMVGSHIGRTPEQLNPVFLQLMRNLGKGTLRVGGTSTDTSCWRTAPDASLPTGCSIEISPNSLRVVSAAMGATDWRAMLGVDLAHYSPTTALDYARDGILPAFAARPGALLGLQFGHEPNLYSAQNRRADSYDHDDFVDEWMAYAQALAGDPSPAMLRPVGPTYGARSLWYAFMRDFLEGTGDMLGGLVAVNDASLSNCGVPTPPTLQQLMASDTIYQGRKRMTDIAETLAPLGAELQIGQTASAQCLGVDGMSNVFGSALWAIDYVFTMVEAGVRRVNFHNARNAYYNPIVSKETDTGGGVFTYDTRATPVYYGLLLASRAAGGRLLRATTSDSSFALVAHAVRAEDGSTLVYLVNKDMTAGGTVAVTPSTPRGSATGIALLAPSLTSRADQVRLGGAMLGSNGAIAAPTGFAVDVASERGTYLVEVPYASAVLLVIPPG